MDRIARYHRGMIAPFAELTLHRSAAMRPANRAAAGSAAGRRRSPLRPRRARAAVRVLCVLTPCALLAGGSSSSSRTHGEPQRTAVGELAYVSNEAGRTLTVIETATDRVVATIPVGTRPRGVRVGKGGRVVYVALSGSPRCPPTMPDEECAKLTSDRSQDGIAIVDATTRTVTRVLPGGVDPEQFDVSPDGRRLYVANEAVASASIVDIASGRVEREVPVGREPEGVRASAAGGLFYVTSEGDNEVAAVEAATGRVTGRVKVDRRPRDLVLMPDGRRYYVSSELGGSVSLVDARQHRVLQRIAMPQGARPMGLALAPAAGRLYVATGRGGTIEVVDTRTQRIVGSVRVGPRPWGIALNGDASKLYVANGPSNDVSIVDTRTLRVLGTIAVGALPWGVAVGPAP